MMNDGQMSQEEIDALLNPGNSSGQPSPAAQTNGGQMSQAEIDALMGGASPSASSDSGGQMSQAEIDALMGGASPSASSDSGGQMSQAEIDALMGGGSPSASSDSGGQMSQAEIDALMGGGSPSASSDSGGQMSQAEIDALMGAAAASDDDTQEEVPLNLPQLSAIEIDAMGEIGNISMGTAATTLAVLLGRRVSITTPRVVVTTLNDVRKKYPMPSFLIEVGYTQGISGTNLLTILEKDALIIANLMMGGDGLNPPPGLDEICMSAVAEAMNQMMGSTATSISTIFKKKIDIAPPKVSVVDFASEDNISDNISQMEPVIRVSFKMEVEDLIDSELTQIMPYDVGKELVQNLMKAMQEQASAPQKPQQAPARQQQTPPPGPPPRQAPSSPPPQVAATMAHPVQSVAVQPVQFQPLTAAPMQMDDSNFGLIMDVPLQVTVELGRTKKLIKEILEFNPGSVVELDKLAGEPVDIFVNGKLIAKGEVVVIDENFGVRITYICNQAERVSTLQ